MYSPYVAGSSSVKNIADFCVLDNSIFNVLSHAMIYKATFSGYREISRREMTTVPARPHFNGGCLSTLDSEAILAEEE